MSRAALKCGGALLVLLFAVPANGFHAVHPLRPASLWSRTSERHRHLVSVATTAKSPLQGGQTISREEGVADGIGESNREGIFAFASRTALGWLAAISIATFAPSVSAITAVRSDAVAESSTVENQHIKLDQSVPTKDGTSSR